MDSIIRDERSKQIIEIGKDVNWLLFGLLSLGLFNGVKVYGVRRCELWK